MNLKSIADGLASAFVNVTATNGTATETATATADLPDTVAKLALLVFPPESSTLSSLMGPRIDDHYAFMVRLLRDPLPMAVRTQWLYAWATALRPKVMQKITLGGTAYEGKAVSMRVEIDGFEFAQVRYDVVEIEVDVHVFELATAAL